MYRLSYCLSSLVVAGDVVIEQASHGGQVYQVAKQLGHPVASFVDFSASVNPLGPSASVVSAMHQAIDGCQHYPDPHSEDLRTRLSQKHGIAEESILIGNGSAEIIRVLPKALGLRHGLIVGPTFSEFERSLRLAGVATSFVNGVSAQRYVPPLEALLEVLKKWKRPLRRKGSVSHDAIFICNPNSPTGRLISRRDLRRIMSEVNRIGCWLIIDEAFIDWCPSHSLIRDRSTCPRLIILRSFTKFFAIPGIRLGYVVGESSVIQSIQEHLPPWSVNHVAQAAGLAALKDWRFCHRSLKFMQQERSHFLKELRSLSGLRVIPSQANFVLVEFPSQELVEAVVMRLQVQGMLVRDCQTFPGMKRPALRFAVRRRRDNHALVQALQKLLNDINA